MSIRNDPPRPTLADAGKLTFVVIEPGVSYRLEVPGMMVTFEVDRLTWRQNELTGELTVHLDLGGTDAVDGVLSVATFNLSNAWQRTQRADLLRRKSRAPDIPWEPLLEAFCQAVLTAERTGEPAVALRDVDPSADDRRLIPVFGFQLPFRHPSIIFGDGGATKSLLALYMGGLLSQQGYRVLIADWELDAVDHRDRYATLFGTEMPATVFYTRCCRPMVYEVDRLKRIVRQQGIDFGIYDSIGYACHEAPETAAAALTYFQAVRQMRIGGLHIAHINRSEHGDQKPFGSAFFHNSARATWFLKPVEDGAGKSVGVFSRKHNLAKYLQAPFSYAVQVDGNRTFFRRTEITEVAELAAKVSLPQRIAASLKAGPRTTKEIGDAWPDEKADTVRKAIERGLKSGRLVIVPDAAGDERIALAARAS
jgi:hypothetical protein